MSGLLVPEGEVICRLELDWCPTSKKNSRRLFMAGSRPLSLPSKEWCEEEKTLRTMLRLAMCGRRMAAADHLLSMLLVHHVPSNEVVLEWRDLGPDPRPPAKHGEGMKRDLINLHEGVADAAQGIVYPDDKRIVKLEAARVFGV